MPACAREPTDRAGPRTSVHPGICSRGRARAICSRGHARAICSRGGAL